MEQINDRVSVKEASQILDVSPQFIRIGLQQQRLPYGTAVQISSEWTYHISRKLLEEYIGKEPVLKILGSYERGDANWLHKKRTKPITKKSCVKKITSRL